MTLSIEERVAEIEAAGWTRRRGGPFMDAVGPLWAKSENGGWAYGLLAQEQHLNLAKVVHGGFLQTLIDHALSVLAWEIAGRRPCVTIEMSSQFLAAAQSNDFIVARSQETGRTRSLIFLRGDLGVKGKGVLSAHAIFKIVRASA